MPTFVKQQVSKLLTRGSYRLWIQPVDALEDLAAAIEKHFAEQPDQA